MLGPLAKLLLVMTSLAPVLLTYAFADYLHRGERSGQLVVILIAAGLVVLAWLVMIGAVRQLPKMSFRAATVRTADAQVVAYLVTYLFPLLAVGTDGFSGQVLGFVLVVIGAVIWTSHAYHFNPLLAIINYHFFEISTEGGMEYLLLSKRDIHSPHDVTHIVRLGHYIVLDASKEETRHG